MGNINFALRLKQILQEECLVLEQYSQLVKEETAHITKFNSQKVEELTANREVLSDKIKLLSESRVALIKELTGSEKTNLNDAINQYFKGREASELKNLREKLRNLTKSCRQSGMEFNQIVNYALNIVNGTLSLIMAATQNIVKSYSRNGLLKETYSPTGSTRRIGVSKEV